MMLFACQLIQLGLGLAGLLLALPHVGIGAAGRQQCLMRAPFGDLAVDQNQNLIGIDHG